MKTLIIMPNLGEEVQSTILVLAEGYFHYWFA